MARSPSPTGSSLSHSRRYRRDEDRDYDRRRSDRERRDDRDRKDDRRRRRSRSRSPVRSDRRYRDESRDRHDYRRRDRSRDHERRRSRERDVRDRPRDRREGSRDRERDRRRRNDSADSRRDRDRDRRPADSRDRPYSKKVEPAPKPSPVSTNAADEEAKKAERLARLEAWKKKQLAATAKSQTATPASTRGIVDDMEKKASASATVTASPATPLSPASPKPYAGKFDPKAIVNSKKQPVQTDSANKLGLDIALPPEVKSAVKKPLPGSKLANPTTSVGKMPSAPLKAVGNLSGFGIKASTETDKAQAKSMTLDFGEEENSKRKLEKLPNLALENGDDDATLANRVQDEDEEDEDVDVDMQDGTEEEAAAAARAAAEKREERLHAQNVAYQDGDFAMQDAEAAPAEPSQPEEAEEEVDELDAFMANLDEAGPSKRSRFTGKKVTEPIAMFGDEDAMEAVDEENTDDIMAMAATKRKKKDIPTVDHAKVAYEPFRKNFYQEPTELAELNEEETADLRLQLEDIKVRGVDVPKPVLSWAQCGLGVQTLDVISKLGYEKPSSIQSQAIPAIMSGRDVIGVAKTGSGKTVAFLIPMFRHLKDQRPLDNLEGPMAIIMTPTRELATQIHKDCRPFLKALNLRAVCAYGGTPIKDQIAELKRGAEIVVCTPGRMIDLLAANAGRVTNLRRVTYCVLDEADRMFDMGFEPQVMKIIANIRPDKQTVLFSATFPRQMEALARKALIKPVEIIVGGRSVVAPEIKQVIEVRAEETKFVRLLQLLGELFEDEDNDHRALVFVERQESADTLFRDLSRKGYPCMPIHGGKEQVDRDETIQNFKSGGLQILIATSVAARGLDVKQLKLVVNFDAPNHLEDYVHRAGRTGRAGNTGTAVTFITEDQDRLSLDLAKALQQSGNEIPEPLQKLVDAFKEKVKEGKEKVAGSGFRGRGLDRLDQDRDAARNVQRKAYKTGDEPEEEDKEEAEKDKKNDDLIAKAASSVQAAGAAPTPSKAIAGVPAGIDLDGKITVHKTEMPAASGSGAGSKSDDPMDKVRAVVGRLNNKVGGGVSSGAPLDNKGPDAGAFHATLEINDFPQKARWAVTNRTNVAKILESTGTSITTKGNFYATGKTPGPNDAPKLYILVEGDTEIVVTDAMRELMRLLKEGAIAAAEGESRAPTGRYNVV